MYILKNNKRVPVSMENESVKEGFSWSVDWPLVVGIGLAVLFVILLIVFLTTAPNSPHAKPRRTARR